MKNEIYSEFLKAKDLIKKHKLKDAEEKLRTLYKLEPNDLVIKFELAKILIKNNKTKLEGKKLLLELLNTNSKTYAMLELGKLEVSKGNNDKAREYFEELLNTNNKIYAVQELIYIEIKENNIIKAYELFEKIVSFNQIELNTKKKLQFYLKYRLGLITKEELPKNYFFSQLINYDEEKFIEHIKSHLDENDNKRLHTQYEKNTNLNIVINDIKMKIQNINPNISTLVDKYLIDYDYDIATINNSLTNRLEVITFSNTKDIITMYPITKLNNDIKIKQMHK